MYDENQTVIVKWNNTNRAWFENKGYVYTKRYEEFSVRVKDLTPRSAAKIKAICDYCGSEYATQFDVIQKGRVAFNKDACPHCASRKASDISRVKRANKFFKALMTVCEENGYSLITQESEFTDVKMNVQYECPKHGVQTAMLDNLIRGHKCRLCSYEERFGSVRLNANFLAEYISSVNGNEWLNPDEYTNSTDRNLRIRCHCGNIYTTSFSNFARGGVNRCHLCSQKESSGELRIREYLESSKINFEQEKRFQDCRDKKPLPFDFYLPQQKMCIEFDGQHHYKDIFKDGKLGIRQAHDKIKNDFCASHGLTILRIPYWNGGKIRDILRENIDIGK